LFADNGFPHGDDDFPHGYDDLTDESESDGADSEWPDNNTLNFVFDDYDGAEDRYIPHFYPGVTEEIFEKAWVLRFLLVAGCSESDYAKYFTKNPLMRNGYHKTLKNFKLMILRILKPSLTIKTLGRFGKETIEFVNPRDVVSLWMTFPEMKNQILEINEKYTRPYISNLDQTMHL
jgi:hypothetical protein